ncbi:hypothetical protein [Streptomyces sp. DT171]|uniref:hypothetical protein n=1 Tax=Streptomyces sp. DT171 TaxID=3416524 RepID=UPI003CEEB363
MATKKPTHRTPPPVGRAVSVRVDTRLYDDLAILMSTGAKASDAVREAVGRLADAYRQAWDYGDTPRGQQPAVRLTTTPRSMPVRRPDQPV